MRRPRWASTVCWFVVAWLTAATSGAQTGEWPQFAGPHRDYKADSTGLAATWPEVGPRRLWSRDLGEGWSAIAVDAGRLYTMYRRGEQDVVISMEAATGKTLWEYAYDAPFVVAGRDADFVKEYHLEQGPGPISTPTIAGDLLFTDSNRSGTIVAYGHVAIYAGGGMQIAAPRTGDVVRLQPVPFDRLRAARRLLGV